MLADKNAYDSQQRRRQKLINLDIKVFKRRASPLSESICEIMISTGKYQNTTSTEPSPTATNKYFSICGEDFRSKTW